MRYRSLSFKEHHAVICEMVGLAKIVFGNAREMTALAKALNLKFRNVADIPFLLNSSKRVTVGVSSAACTSNEWLTDNDIFVMTQGGSAPAIVVWGQGHFVQVLSCFPIIHPRISNVRQYRVSRGDIVSILRQ